MIESLLNKQPSQKAYKINFSKIDEGFCYSEVFTVGNSREQAKGKLLKMSDGMQLYNGKEITYLNLPIIRYPEEDLFDFESSQLSRYSITKILRQRKRDVILDGILNDKNISHCYIKKRGSYYQPNSCGYTDFQHRAVYTKEESVSMAKSCDELFIIPIDIEIHNNMLRQEIENLQTKIL